MTNRREVLGWLGGMVVAPLLKPAEAVPVSYKPDSLDSGPDWLMARERFDLNYLTDVTFFLKRKPLAGTVYVQIMNSDHENPLMMVTFDVSGLPDTILVDHSSLECGDSYPNLDETATEVSHTKGTVRLSNLSPFPCDGYALITYDYLTEAV